MAKWFTRFSAITAHLAGHYLTFIVALGIVIVWALTGPLFGFSDTWQLVINTGTTIVTFLMVFLIQNTQNRDAKAVHLKLDEPIRAVGEARTQLVDLESLSDEELDRYQVEFHELREHYGAQAERVRTESHRRRTEDRHDDRG